MPGAERLRCAQHATPPAPRPRLGAVSFLHRFGSGLNRHAHLHAAVTDGVFLPGPHGPDAPPAFLPARPLTAADLAEIPLTEQSARVVAASRSEVFTGSLPGITAFDSPESVAVAKALAKRQGPLALPNLKKISPKTLSALLEKDDIDIPLIETLDLIPEPDGSPTEDFVIPERFQKR